MVAIILYSWCVAFEFVLKKVRNVFFVSSWRLLSISVYVATRGTAHAPLPWRRVGSGELRIQEADLRAVSSFSHDERGDSTFQCSLEKKRRWEWAAGELSVFRLKQEEVSCSVVLDMLYKIEYCCIYISFHQWIWLMNYKWILSSIFARTTVWKFPHSILINHKLEKSQTKEDL